MDDPGPILVSACLLGFECRHDGRSRTDAAVLARLTRRAVVPVCPEAAAGLGIPREAFAFVGDRLVGAMSGRDATEEFSFGAQAAVDAAARWHADAAHALRLLPDEPDAAPAGAPLLGDLSGRAPTPLRGIEKG